MNSTGDYTHRRGVVIGVGEGQMTHGPKAIDNPRGHLNSALARWTPCAEAVEICGSVAAFEALLGLWKGLLGESDHRVRTVLNEQLSAATEATVDNYAAHVATCRKLGQGEVRPGLVVTAPSCGD